MCFAWAGANDSQHRRLSQGLCQAPGFWDVTHTVQQAESAEGKHLEAQQEPFRALASSLGVPCQAEIYGDDLRVEPNAFAWVRIAEVLE